MKNKSLVLSLLLSVLATACSENAYTPNTGMPINNTGTMNPNTGTMYPSNGIQNNFQYPQMNQLGMQNYQQRGRIFSWNMRMNMGMPGYNYYNYNSRSCIPHQTYTITYRKRTNYNTCYSCTNTNTPAVDPTTTEPVTVTNPATVTEPAVVAETTEVLPISFKGEDAKALYQRLTREEKKVKEPLFSFKNVKFRTGDHYKCIVDGRESKADNYVCDIHIQIKDGTLLENLPVGKPAQPEITSSSMYIGDLLNIGIPGQAPEIGYLTINGDSATSLFKKLPGEAVQGKVEEAGNVNAKIKTVGQVKCYETTNAINNTTECLLKIDSANGRALDF